MAWRISSEPPRRYNDRPHARMSKGLIDSARDEKGSAAFLLVLAVFLIAAGIAPLSFLTPTRRTPTS